jgi:hypothetical protein
MVHSHKSGFLPTAVIVYTLCTFSSSVFSAIYGGGSGIPEDPYQIWTAEQLIEIGSNPTDYDKCFIVMADLDLTGKTSFQAFIAKDTSVSQTGFQGTGFSGCLDGNGHIIRKMTISYDRAGTKYGYLGLFGLIDSTGVVKNLSLDEMSISPSTQVSRIGGIAGTCLGRIENCHVNGDIAYLMMPSGGMVNSISSVGGITGSIEGGLVLHCDFSGPIWGASDIGGIAGRNTGTVGFCQANSTILGTNMIGGLVGWSNGTIQDSTSRGAINGGSILGGLIGQQEQGSVSRCDSTVSISMGGTGKFYMGLYAGGLIGHCLSSQVEDCFATGTIALTTTMANVAGGLIGRSAQSNLSRCYAMGSIASPCSSIGGLVGEIFEGGIIQDCFARGSVTGLNFLGGLIGKASRKEDLFIRNCYAMGMVNGSGDVGGLVGYFAGNTLVNSYSSGVVVGTSYSGGLVGHLVEGSVSNSFWDMDTSGKTASAGGVGKTTAELKTPATFTDAGWDFVGETANGTEDIWRLCLEGIDYPGLATISASHGDYACPEGVGMDDLMVLAERWMGTTPGEIGSADGNRDGIVNLSDFGILAKNWMIDPLSLSLVARWKMDGDFSDSAGGYTGTAVGDPVFVGQDQAKVGNGAVELDDNDEVVISGFQGIPGPAPRTCTAWVKIQPVSFLSGRILEWGDSKTTGGLWRIGITEGVLSLDIGEGFLHGRTRVDTGQWVHVAVVLPDGKQSNADVLLYINGCSDSVEVDHSPIDPQHQININTILNQGVRIGFVPSGTFAPFTGMIDDVRIYNRGLSADEIAGLAANSPVFAGLDHLVNLHNGNRGILKGQFSGDWVGSSVQWEQISGPESVAIADPAALITTADFGIEGKYGFRLTATDGIITATDEVDITVTNGLVRYWPFDGDLLDFLGNPAVPMENPIFVEPPKAKVGNGAIRLSNYSWIDVPDFKGITGTHARTCMAWVWIEPAGGPTLPILSWGDKNVAGGSWDVQINSFGKLQVQISGGGSMAGVSVANYFEWIHVAAVLPEGGDSAEDLRLYFNGVQETGTIKAGAINTIAKDAMRIGTDGTSYYFTGRIDDVRVYDRALTAEEIAAIAGN